MRKTQLIIFLTALALYLTVMGGHIYSPDGEIMFRTTQSIAERGTFAIEPLGGFATRKGIDEKEYAQYGIGQPLIATPLYFVGRFVLNHTPTSFHERFVLDTTQYHSETPREYLLRFFVSLFNQIVSALTCVALFSFCYLLTKDKNASIIVTIIYGIATMALPHSRTFFSEPLATLTILLSLYYVERWSMERERVSLLIWGGVFAGYALLTRLDSVVSIPAVYALLKLRLIDWKGEKLTSKFRQTLKSRDYFIKLLIFSIPVFVCMVIYLLLNKARYGSFYSTGYEDQTEGIRFSTPLLMGLYGFFFSIGKGLFFFSPPLVLFFFAIRKFLKKHPETGVAFIVLIVCNLVFHSKWQNWAGGWCWGPRHIFIIHCFLAIPIIALLAGERISSALKITLVVLIIVGSCVQLYGSSQSFIDFYILFFKTPQNAPSFYTLHTKGDVVFQRTPAPINDSIYIPQNSQWRGYGIMRQYGHTDFFWMNFFRQKTEP